MIRKATRNFQTRSRLGLSFALLLALTGCATSGTDLSSAGGQASPVSSGGPALAAVIEQPQAHQNRSVSWGGTLVSIENTEEATLLEVVGRPLAADGRPNLSSQSNGRFMAVVPGFLDPVDYRSGQVISVNGTIDGSDRRQIGGASYDYPKVAVVDHKLWAPVGTQVASNYKHGYSDRYYSPFRGSISIGFGSRARFGISASKRFGHGRKGYGHSRSRYSTHRGYRGHRRHSSRIQYYVHKKHGYSK